MRTSCYVIILSLVFQSCSARCSAHVHSLLLSQPQNILLTSLSPPGDIKIVDFGLARRLGAVGELREILGTPEYVGKMTIIKHFPVFRQPYHIKVTDRGAPQEWKSKLKTPVGRKNLKVSVV